MSYCTYSFYDTQFLSNWVGAFLGTWPWPSLIIGSAFNTPFVTFASINQVEIMHLNTALACNVAYRQTNQPGKMITLVIWWWLQSIPFLTISGVMRLITSKMVPKSSNTAGGKMPISGPEVLRRLGAPEFLRSAKTLGDLLQLGKSSTNGGWLHFSSMYVLYSAFNISVFISVSEE